MTEIKPCPFCGSNDLQVNEDFVLCNQCSCEGSLIESSSIDSWNTRHSPWISVKDRLPDNEEDVLVSDGDIIFSAYLDRKRYWYSYESRTGLINEITHWMPLPELPGESK